MKRLLPFLSIALMAVSCIQDPESPMNLPDAPVLSVDETSVTRVSMLVNGNFGKNMTDITAYGVEISETLFEAGKTYKSLTPQVTGSSFSLGVTDLKSNNTYFLRAFIGNGHSKMYSSTITQQTPETSVASISDVTVRDNFLVATIEDNGGRSIEEVGFMWGTSSERKDLKREKRYPGTLSADGKTFTMSLAEVGQGTHYVLAYAEDDRDGTGYSRIPFELVLDEPVEPEEPEISASKYLTFTSEGTTKISMIHEGENAPVLYYSTDAKNWEQWNYSELSFTANAPLYIFGDNPEGFSFSASKKSRFVTSGDHFAVSGSVMSLLDGNESILTIPSVCCFLELFKDCADLTSAPSLPATVLTKSCYAGMFRDCRSLTKAPELPAKTMADECYYTMFSGCSSLAAAPELPATNLAYRCYAWMFEECFELTTAPAILPATNLETECYRGLFFRCSSLLNTPELPATVMAEGCYHAMFYECGSLTSAPELPATTLAKDCYRGMFWNSPSLVNAPELPARTLADSCYLALFDGCVQLGRVKCLATDISASGCLDNWLNNVAPQGTFVKSAQMNDWPTGASGIPEGWTVENDDGTPIISASKYLTFTSEGTTTIYLQKWVGDNNPVVFYSEDLKSWNEWDYSELTFKQGKPLYICGDNPEGFNKAVNLVRRFASYGGFFAVTGDVMSLINKDEDVNVIPSDYCFYGLFKNCENLKAAPELPATTLTFACYWEMFYGCRSLTATPQLPATTMAEECYHDMFSGCASLTSVSALPSTDLAKECYKGMFNGCTSLSVAPELPATILAESCYDNMFTFSGITSAPVLPATTLERGCYANMFSYCTSLITAPDLPATTLAHGCYSGMFNHCTKLNYIKCLGTDDTRFPCLFQWVEGVASTGTFVKASSIGIAEGETGSGVLVQNSYGQWKWPIGASGIPEGWTVENDDGTPVISASKYLTFTSEGTTTMSISRPEVFYISRNATDWECWDGSELTFTGESPLYVCGDNPGGIPYSRFITSGDLFSVSGSIMSLLNKDEELTVLPEMCFDAPFRDCKNLAIAPSLPATTLSQACYEFFFSGCVNLTKAPDLPATTLSLGCYRGMFDGCSSLKTAPELPAISMEESCYSEMFARCTSLMEAPELPATTLAPSCYESMFWGCSGMTTPPSVLPATVLVERCYENMFYECTSMVSAPELSATNLIEGCYAHMFEDCTSLVTGPSILPATTLTERCYYEMFKGCTSLQTAPVISATSLAKECCLEMFFECIKLTKAPELPATTLAPDCYEMMFGGCSSLISVPTVLPATTLAEYCYGGMFYGCSNLEVAPELPAMTLSEFCYDFMFYDCSKLNYVKCLATDISEANCVDNWLTNVSETGIFVKSASMKDWPTGASGIPEGWTVENDDGTPIISASKYLTFTSEGTTLVSLTNTGGNAPVLYYSTDAKNWTQWDYGVLSVMAGTPLYICGDNPDGFSTYYDKYSAFSINGHHYSVSGSVMSLLNYEADLTSIPSNYCFYRLFNGSSILMSAPELPATHLKNSCYQEMFRECSGLTVPPELPATSLAQACYHSMFLNCTGLTSATSLPATSIPNYGYRSMFSGCSSLTTAPELPATSFNGFECYEEMFKGCTSLESAPGLPVTSLTNACYVSMFEGCVSLKVAPALPATQLSGRCYESMFKDCTSLIIAPELPATVFSDAPYKSMFEGCTSLITAPDLPATDLVLQCYMNMFTGCTSLTSAPALPATTLAGQCYYEMFSGCTALKYAPALPAKTLVETCYSRMFQGCSSLSYVKCLATDLSGSSCLQSWLSGVSSTGTFVKSANTQWPSGASGIPEGWTVENEDGTPIISASKYLTFTSEGTTLVSLANTGGNAPVLYYSTDAQNWTQWDYSALTFTADSPIYICGDNPEGINSGYEKHSHFDTSGSNYSVSGDIMSLLDKDNDMSAIPSDDCFYALFEDCSGMTSVPELPATTLTRSCYQAMFFGCTSLTTAPELPATTLTYGCYSGMFSGCESLTTAPELPATTLAGQCYAGMFDDCISLTTAPELPATTLAGHCYHRMFIDCVSLTTAPELPANTLAEGCYGAMFYSCGNLSYVKCLATDISAENSLTDWMIGVASSGTFVKSAQMNDWPTGASGIPEGWTVKNDGESDTGTSEDFGFENWD